MICKFAYQCHIGLLKSYRYFMTYRDMIPLHLTSGYFDYEDFIIRFIMDFKPEVNNIGHFFSFPKYKAHSEKKLAPVHRSLEEVG